MSDETLTVRIWRGREYLGVEDLISEGIWPAEGKKSLDGQAVLLGITWRPTPPHPITATDSPRCTRATLRTAPIPVTTPHPRRAACHNGNPSGIGTAPPAATTVRSAKQAVRRPCFRVVPSGSRSRLVPSISIPCAPCSATTAHRLGLPAVQ